MLVTPIERQVLVIFEYVYNQAKCKEREKAWQLDL